VDIDRTSQWYQKFYFEPVLLRTLLLEVTRRGNLHDDRHMVAEICLLGKTNVRSAG